MLLEAESRIEIPQTTNLISVRGIAKSFGSNQALKHVNFDLNSGEVHCLLGENGAGKSTLMNILFGLYIADDGEISIRGETSKFANPREAIDAQIGMVHQQFMLVPTMSVAENVLIGEAGPLERFNKGARIQKLRNLLDRYQFDIDMNTAVGDLSLGQRQRVEIAKLLYRNAEVLILDEPTSVLTPQEVEILFGTLRQLTADGIGVILITHKLHEVKAIGDRVTVLRHGEAVYSADVRDVTEADLTHQMFGEVVSGREISAKPLSTPQEDTNPILVVKNASTLGDNGLTAIKSLNLSIGPGEIVGVAGVSGEGQRELAEMLVGIRPMSSGSAHLRGMSLSKISPRSARKIGLVHMPEERSAGLGKDLTIAENLQIADYHDEKFSRAGLIKTRVLATFSKRLAEQFNVPVERLGLNIGTLSGGNQQRIIVARALVRKPDCVIASQATKGLDAATRDFVHEQLRDVANGGGGILYISTDLDELMAFSDRIVVLYEGRISGTFNAGQYDKNNIGYLMAGGAENTK